METQKTEQVNNCVEDENNLKDVTRQKLRKNDVARCKRRNKMKQTERETRPWRKVKAQLASHRNSQ